MPLCVGFLAANTHGKSASRRLAEGIPPIRSRRGPRRPRPCRLHADKEDDHAWLRARGITPCIARRGIQSSTRVGRLAVSWNGPRPG
ncbi:hypothetical protein GCM10022214_52010 [Actinomadura miaoliensis]|uniref:Transposase n=1 Tax=Actinomadura miaoliensis TaxID=430685 RepID=A0ABP7WC40_9ACTN